MEISKSLTCLCNNKLYPSKISLKQHFKTQCHQIWEQMKEKKEILIKINRLENENSQLRRLNILLIERISSIEKNNIK